LSEQYNPFDYVNSINNKTVNYTNDEGYMRHYPPYMVNRAMSYHMDTVLHSNEMNRLHPLDKDMQYHFYLYSVRKSKRFSSWGKKDTPKDLDIVKEYYGYSTEKAKEALRILSKEQIKVIKAKLDTGGLK